MWSNLVLFWPWRKQCKTMAIQSEASTLHEVAEVLQGQEQLFKARMDFEIHKQSKFDSLARG